MRGTAVFHAFYARVPYYIGDIWPSLAPSFVSFVVLFVSVNGRQKHRLKMIIKILACVGFDDIRLFNWPETKGESDRLAEPTITS